MNEITFRGLLVETTFRQYDEAAVPAAALRVQLAQYPGLSMSVPITAGMRPRELADRLEAVTVWLRSMENMPKHRDIGEVPA